MSDSQPEPAGREIIGLVPDEFANELIAFANQCESADEAQQGELIKEMAKRIVEMIEKNPENRDRIISRLWAISDTQTDTSRLILQNSLVSQVLYLVTDPEKRKGKESGKDPDGETGQVKKKRRFFSRLFSGTERLKIIQSTSNPQS